MTKRRQKFYNLQFQNGGQPSYLRQPIRIQSASERTTDAIFTVRQMQEKYGCKGKKLYFAFVDFEKAFDRVPR